MANGDDGEGKVVSLPKSAGIVAAQTGSPSRINRGAIDSSIDEVVSKRKTLGDAFVEFVGAAPIWLWLVVAAVLFGLAKTLEYLTTRFYAHMASEATTNVSQNSVDMLLAWNRLAHFLNGFWYGFMGLAGVIVVLCLIRVIRKYFMS